MLNSLSALRFLAALTLLLLALGVPKASSAQDLPETEFIRYEYMDYSVYDQQFGWTLESRVVPHYTGGVLDTVFINQHNGDQTFSPYRRIRYTPFSLFPEKAITEQLNAGFWITVRTDSFAYISGIRTMKISRMLEGSNLDSTVRSKYEYNGEGKVSARTDEALVKGKWVLLKKVAYLYDDAYHVLGLEDSTLKNGIFVQTGRELRDYVDGALDEITREVGLHPNFSGVEKFRYWFTKPWNPALTYSVEKETFFDTLVGASQTRDLIIRNPNSEPVIVAGLKIKSGNSFKLQDAILTSYAIPSKGELRVPIIFTPKFRGTHVDSVVVTVNGGVNTTAALVGIARSGVLVLIPSSPDFGTIVIGDTATRPLKLRNDGDAPLVIDSIVSLNTAFIAHDLTTQLKPLVSIEVPLRFIPLAPGLHAGSFRIYYHDEARSRDTIILARGTGAAEMIDRHGILAIDQIALDFDTIFVGDTARLTINLSNIGDTLLHLDTAIASTSAFETSAFGIKTLAPTEHTSLDLEFVPTFAGDFEATVLITYGDPDLLLDTTITLRGVAITKPIESVAEDPLALKVQVYPNPAADRIVISSVARILSGYFVTITGLKTELDPQQLATGILSTVGLPGGYVTLVLETSEGMISRKVLIAR
jgi:hypothetical protein